MSRPSDPGKLTEWRERFERLVASGLTVARFCAREGVSVASFYHWRKKLGVKGRPDLRPLLGHHARRRDMGNGHLRHRTGPTGGRGVFQPVAVVPAARAICIQMPCGTRIEVYAGDLDAVRTVVAELARVYREREAGMA